VFREVLFIPLEECGHVVGQEVDLALNLLGLAGLESTAIHHAGGLDEFLPDVWFASHPSTRRETAA
jgi:hypothetical protein